MNKRTKEFLERFKDFDNNDIKVIFGDIFSEFIGVLNDVDLSEKTLIYLNGIFEKDMFLFFDKLIKNYDEKIIDCINVLENIIGDSNYLTFEKLSNIIEKYNIPKDVHLMSDSGWECNATEMNGILYNEKEKIIELMKSKLFYYDKSSNETIMTFIKEYRDNWGYLCEDKIYINIDNKTVICEGDYEAMEIETELLLILNQIFEIFNS